ncbi:MAG: hypothetical protein G01um1014107_55, partial [Parcubacteria group bacterium Gr01-1014_107]
MVVVGTLSVVVQILMFAYGIGSVIGSHAKTKDELDQQLSSPTPSFVQRVATGK